MIDSVQSSLRKDRLLLRRMVQSSAAIVAVLVVLVLPLGYGLIAYNHEVADAQREATLSARQVAGYVFQHLSLWEFNSERLSEMIGTHQTDLTGDTRRRILKPDGHVLVTRGALSANLTMVHRAPIVVGDATLAYLDLESSIDMLLLRVGACAVVGLCLGVFADFAFRSLPLHALDNALGDLDRLQSHIVETNRELTAQNSRLLEQEDALRPLLLLQSRHERSRAAQDCAGARSAPGHRVACRSRRALPAPD